MTSVFTELYDTVYYAAELRAQRKLGGRDEGLSNDHKESLGDVKTARQRMQRFFGLPAGDSLGAVAGKFLFFPSGRSKAIKLLWGIALLVIVPVQISVVVLRCLRNILKLVTEFLPRALALSFYRAFISLRAIVGNESAYSTPARVFAGFFALLTGVLFAAFGLCYLIGRATTSPIESVRASYEYGESKHPVLGVLLAALSVALTACVYAVLFPLAIKFLLMQTAAVVSSAPHWVMSTLNFIAQQGVGLSSFLSSILPSSLLTAFNAPMTASLMAGLSLVGITLFGGVASVGAVGDQVTDPGSDNYGRSCLELIVEPGEDPLDEDVYKGIFSNPEANRDAQITELRKADHGKRALISSAYEMY
jgi:hypothetical protein